MSERILFRLLQQLEPTEQHSLAGLDHITADRMNGFSVLEKSSKPLPEKQKPCLFTWERETLFFKDTVPD